MTTATADDRPRTLLAQLLRDRRWSIDDFRRRYDAASRAIPAGRHLTISDRQAKRWLAGTVAGRPYPAACLVLEHMFKFSVDDLLGPAAVDQAPQASAPQPVAHTWPRSHPAIAPAHRTHPHTRTQAPAAADTDAEEAFRFLARAENTAAPEILALLWNEVRRLANSYGDHLALLVNDLAVARKAVFRLLDGPTDPAQARDLYFLGGLVCAMLVHASRDLGHTERALMYERTALLCADRAGHPGLHIVIATEQAATAYWMARYTDSIHYTERAQQHAAHVHGSIAVLPAVQQARAYAAIGDIEHARVALATSHQIRSRVQPDDLDAIGGIMRLSLPEQLGIIAGTAAWLPDPAAAERAAADAVMAYENAPYADRSHNSFAIAHADLALARVRLHELDGARQALQPVLSIPAHHRVLPICTGAHRVITALDTDPAYQHSPQARDLTANINAYVSESAQLALPD